MFEKCEFCEKMRLWQCEFCQKWGFENVNFVKNEILEMWILSNTQCEFSYKLGTFAPVWTEASRFYSKHRFLFHFMYSFGHNKNVERWYCSGGKILWISFLILKIVLGLLRWDDPEEVVISADPPRSFTKMMVKVQKALNIMET